MDGSLKSEDILMQLRDKLTKDGVKLWLEPYYKELTGSSHEHLKVIPAIHCFLIQLSTFVTSNLKRSILRQ